jgi:aminopeptidase N
MDKLNEYRDAIYSARKYWFWSGEESGPIALGYRTSSSKTRGDYGLIIYKKAAFVLHMLRNFMIDLATMNEDHFLKMMRDWYHLNKGKKTTTQDFKLHVENYTGIDMTWFFDQYIYGHELPTYEFSYDLQIREDGQYLATCHVEQIDVPAGWIDYIPIEIEFNDGGKAYLRLLIDQPTSDLELPPIGSVVKKIRLNPFNSVLAKVKD